MVASSNRKVLAFDLSTPSMPDMLSMPAPALPTPDVNRTSKLPNEMSKFDHNANANVPMMMKKKKKHLMGRRLLQLKKRLTSKSKSASKQEEDQEQVCLSQGTSATTSTSSFGPTSLSSEEKGEDVPFMDEMDMMTMNMTTTLKPRVRSMFQKEEEDTMIMMPMMPLPAAPWSSCLPLSSSSPDEIITSTPPPSSFSSKLSKALSVLSLDDDDNDDGNADDTDDWGIFASFNDDDDDEHDDIDDDYNHHHVSKFSSSRSLVTKSNNALYFQPRTHLPAVFAATVLQLEQNRV